MSVNGVRFVSQVARWSVLPALLLCLGCSSDEKRVTVHPVTGKISVGGEAPVGAQIVLHSVSPSIDAKLAPTAKVQKDGTFKVSSYQSGDGAPEGEYVATISWYKITEGGVRGDDVVPKKYSSAETSPIKISVKSGSNEVPPIDVPKT
jgi:hypothetical protein